MMRQRMAYSGLAVFNWTANLVRHELNQVDLESDCSDMYCAGVTRDFVAELSTH